MTDTKRWTVSTGQNPGHDPDFSKNDWPFMIWANDNLNRLNCCWTFARNESDAQNKQIELDTQLNRGVSPINL